MKKTTKMSPITRYILTLISVMGFVVQSFAQCPTVTTPLQSFCDVDNPTVANLSATNNGGGIKWYPSLTSTTPLPASAILINNSRYYADDNSGSCGSRQHVDVRIYGKPIATNFQGICVLSNNTATISNLVAIGNDVQWYYTQYGGTPIPPATLLIHNSFYYVDQSNPDTGCRTSRLEVLVNIGIVPIPVADSIQEFCSDTQPTIADLVATGVNKWYIDEESKSALSYSTPLIDGQSYYATTVDPPCESARKKVTVILQQPNNSGANGEYEICETGLITTGSVNLFDGLLGSPEATGVWTGPVTTTNGHLGKVNVTNMTVAGSPYVFNYTVSSVACPTKASTVTIYISESANAGLNTEITLCSNDAPQDLFDLLDGNPEPGGTWSSGLSGYGIFDPKTNAPGTYTYTVQGVPPCGEASATIKITVNPAPQPGTNGSLMICENGAPENLFDHLNGTPQTGGTWSPALKRNDGYFDPTRDTADTYTYTVTGISPCESASAQVVVTIKALPNVGTKGSLILCSSDAPRDLFKSLGGNPASGGTWSPILKSGTGVFNPAVDLPGEYTYTIQGESPCNAASAKVEVKVSPKADAGTDGTLIICESSAPQNLFDSLGGQPQSGGTWSPALKGGTNIFDPTIDTAPVYTYNVSGVSPCGDASAKVIITINPAPDAGIDGELLICSNAAPQNLFNHLKGTPDKGGIWTPTLTSQTDEFDPTKDLARVYTYTVKGAASCGEATATVTVKITPQAQPGTSTNLTICDDGAPVNLFDSLGANAQLGGTWSPRLVSRTGIFDPLVDAAGPYTYTVAGTSPCGNESATVTVIIATDPNAGADGRLVICDNDAPQDLFEKLGINAEAGGIWSPSLVSGTGYFDPTVDPAVRYTYTLTTPCGTDSSDVMVTVIPAPNRTGFTVSSQDICLEEDGEVILSGGIYLADGNYTLLYELSGANTAKETLSLNITDGATVITIPAALLTNVGNTTFSIINLIDPVTFCGITTDPLLKVEFNIEQAQTPQLLPNGNEFCEVDAPTIAELRSNLAGTDIIIWYDALINGNEYTEDTLLIDGNTYYALNTTANGCTNGIPLEITVSIKPCDLLIPDGFSPNGDNINDTFKINNLSKLYPNFKLQIYNRYGNILYKGDKNTPNWDGTSNQGRELGNSVLPVGVYYFILELNAPDTKTIQGRIYLNR